MIIDTARNWAAYLGLVDLVRSKRALAFVGAGVTCPFGYPSWGTLITDLAATVRAAHGEQLQSNGQEITIDQVLREFKHKPLFVSVWLPLPANELPEYICGTIFLPLASVTTAEGPVPSRYIDIPELSVVLTVAEVW